MADIHRHGGHGRSAARTRPSSPEPARRQVVSIVHLTQWQRYLDRLRRLVRHSIHH